MKNSELIKDKVDVIFQAKELKKPKTMTLREAIALANKSLKKVYVDICGIKYEVTDCLTSVTRGQTLTLAYVTNHLKDLVQVEVIDE